MPLEHCDGKRAKNRAFTFGFTGARSMAASIPLFVAASLACQHPKITPVSGHAVAPGGSHAALSKAMAGIGSKTTAVAPNDFVSLALFLGQALSHRDDAALRAARYSLGDDPCIPMIWRLPRNEQEKLTLDWTLLEFHLDAPNPVEPGTVLQAYLNYSVFVFSDATIRYFRIEYRGSDGDARNDRAPRFSTGFEAQTKHLIEVGFGDKCADAQSLSEAEADIVLSQGGESLLPFIVERVQLRPVCHALEYGFPLLPRSGWKLGAVRLLAQSHGPSGRFAVAAFVVPEADEFRLLAYDPLYLQRSDVEAIRACEQADYRP
jgi:hypothetical protein